MKKPIFLVFIFICSLQLCNAQSDKNKPELSPEQTRQIMSSIKLDTTKLLSEHSLKACQCLDSLLKVRKAGDGSKSVEDIAYCIGEEVTGYQAVMKVYQSLASPEKDIIINTNKNSPEYKRYYTDIEHWLMDSCLSMKMMLGSTDNEETELSFSKDPEAIKQYNAGIRFFTSENYKEALPCFKKAVEADPKFVFAWDNLGICYRRTGDLENALTAYSRSLELSPRGRTPLQNIPVVYELRKDYSRALQAYKNFLQYYPDDAEAYYGMGRICIAFTNDFENGVDHMCKAYNIYVKEKSPYRIDAEKNLGFAYQKMKEQGKEELFLKILKDNNISPK